MALSVSCSLHWWENNRRMSKYNCTRVKKLVTDKKYSPDGPVTLKNSPDGPVCQKCTKIVRMALQYCMGPGNRMDPGDIEWVRFLM